MKLTTNQATVVLVALLASLGFATYRVTLKSAERPIESVPPKIEFGDVVQGNKVSRTIQIRNVSGRHLTIAEIMTSCGCTTATSLHDLNPGESQPMTVTFNSGGNSGQVEKSVKIASKEFEEKPLEVLLTANVVVQYAANPASLDLGKLDQKGTKLIEFDLQRVDGKPMAQPTLDVPGVKTWAVEKKGPMSYHVKGELKPEGQPGDYSLKIAASEASSNQKFEIPLTFKIASLYLPEPEAVNCGVVRTGQTKEVVIALRGPGANQFAVLNTPSNVAAKVEPVSPTECRLRVSFAAKGEKRYLSQQISLRTENPRQPSLVIPFYAAVDAP